MSNPLTETLIPVADVESIGLGVGRRSIGRLIKDPPEGFPTVLRIKGRLYVISSELESYKSKLIAEALSAPALRNPRAA